MSNRSYIILASFILILAVLLGAYGAHGLKSFMGDHGMTTFKTGNRYHFYHGFAIFIVTLLHFHLKIHHLKRIVFFFTAGILFFSGSLYLLAIKSLFNSTITDLLGPITPIGGLFFIVGWSLLIISLINKPNQL